MELTGLRRRPKPRRYGVAAGLVSPDAKWYRSSHRPVIHRAHPPALRAKSRLRAFGFLDTAANGPTRGVDNHYESPAAGPEHQRCTKDHGVKIILIWNRLAPKKHWRQTPKARGTAGGEAFGLDQSFDQPRFLAPSCTLGPHFVPQLGPAVSGVRFGFPKKDFV